MKLVSLSRKPDGPADPSSVSDAEAKKEVMAMITTFKLDGKTIIDIIDLQRQLRLPVNQIARIMDLLEREGRVRER